MPVVLRYKGYKFFFFSNEGSPREPLRIHVRKGESTAKFWLEPDVLVVDSYNMTAAELMELARVIGFNHQLIKRSWHDFFGK